MTLSPSLRRSLPMILMIAGGVVLGVITRLTMPGNAVAMFLWAVLIVGVTGVFSVLCWRRLDEVAREAHKTAWFWGGSTGMLCAFLYFIWAQRFAPELLTHGLHGGRSAADLVEFGLVGVVGAQLVGYLIVWAGWWFVRR